MPIALHLLCLLSAGSLPAVTLPTERPVSSLTMLGASFQDGASPPPAAAPGGRVIRISGAIMAANTLIKVQPVYPPEARAQGIAGVVILAALVDSEGLVKDLQVVSGPEVLRAPTLEAVRQWIYRPYLLNGRPVAVHTTITVNFSLDATH